MPVNPQTKQPTVAKPRVKKRAPSVRGAGNTHDGGKYKKDRKWAPDPEAAERQRKADNKYRGGKDSFKFGEINPNAPKTPEERKRNKQLPICGAPRTGKSSSGPGICCQPAGWGTPHPGFGRCKHHGGSLPAQVKQGEIEKAEKAVIMFGADKDIHPQLALLEEVQRTAGHVDWLRDLITQFDDKTKLTQFTEAGIAPSVWIQLYQDERSHLLKACSEAIKCGVAERQVRIAEEQGRLMAMVLMAFIHDPDMQLDTRQMSLAPKLIRKHLLGMPAEISEDAMPKAARAAVAQEAKVIDV